MESKEWRKHTVRVRYQETDQMGVVYHGNYLNWFEIGRTEYVREMGYSYRNIEKLGLYLPVVDAQISFKRPAKYDDVVDIYTKVAEFTSKKIIFENVVRKGEDILVTGKTVHVWLNSQWKTIRLDVEAPELYERLLKG
ncbi:acyl-CoA thioesterase [Chengkuizengella axinellae]|uniref:Thioesterase family protein n=1 Tax=Chengkuizengella axinellae TaxID=3064388 RepID=A0ABT9IYM5_9BACL|nr:thioesterase family protein [Chengkuizengella sp. 2205SS18-9]MDP5274413.1 thioesterase family protein [Chengkuizengella sp. 2205SS18-9]